MKEIFTKIYKNNEWLSTESVSGWGSEMGRTVEIREQLPYIFNRYDIKQLLDLGCGDFNWMRHVIGGLDRYIGVDIVEEVIISNKNRYSSEKVQFFCQNIQSVEFNNDYDAVIIRDVLVHFSFNDINIILSKILGSNIKYFFTTSFLSESQNRDIPTGTWRRLNFLLPPFNFPAPAETIISYSEPYSDMDGRPCWDKTLSMWNIEDIKRK